MDWIYNLLANALPEFIGGLMTAALLATLPRLRTRLQEPRVRTALLLVGTAVVFYWIGLGITKFQLSRSTSETPPVAIAVDPTKDWQPTNISVDKGSLVTIRVIGGQWSAYKDWAMNNGKGTEFNCGDFAKPNDQCPVLNYSIGALVTNGASH